MTTIKKSSTRKKLIMGFMLGLALFFTLSLLPKKNNKKVDPPRQKISAKSFDQYLVHTKFRSNQVTLSEEQELAYAKFVDQDFEAAIPLLQKVFEEKRDFVAYYYLGICYFLQGDLEKAEAILKHERLRFYNVPI